MRCRPRTGSRTDHGFSGADLANLVNEAALAARRRRASAVELQDFTATIERIRRPEKKSRVLNPKERETVAHHEMGHALVLPETDPVHKIRSSRAASARWATPLQRPTEDRFLMTRTDPEHKDRRTAGGACRRKAGVRRVVYRAADDLARATDIARDMITRFGMDEGLATSPSRRSGPAFSIHLNWPTAVAGWPNRPSARIDQAIRDIVMGVFERAYRDFDINRAVLERCARERWRGKRSTKAISVN